MTVAEEDEEEYGTSFVGSNNVVIGMDGFDNWEGDDKKGGGLFHPASVCWYRWIAVYADTKFVVLFIIASLL